MTCIWMQSLAFGIQQSHYIITIDTTAIEGQEDSHEEAEAGDKRKGCTVGCHVSCGQSTT